MRKFRAIAESANQSAIWYPEEEGVILLGVTPHSVTFDISQA